MNLDGAEGETFQLLEGDGIALSGQLFRPGNETKTYFKRIHGTFEKRTFLIDEYGFRTETSSNKVTYDFANESFSTDSLSFHVERSGKVAFTFFSIHEFLNNKPELIYKHVDCMLV